MKNLLSTHLYHCDLYMYMITLVYSDVVLLQNNLLSLKSKYRVYIKYGCSILNHDFAIEQVPALFT